MAGPVAIEATISGRVQGVWYRGWTQENARRRGLVGWVRNAPDGTVVALFVGPEAEVEDMLAACREGPRHAVVTRVETSRIASAPALVSFEILR